MRTGRAILIGILMIYTDAASSQVEIRTPAIQFYNNCLNSAITNNHVTNRSGNIEYSCYGSAAKRWFDGLPGGRYVDDGRNGTFISRDYGSSGYCAQHITDADGTANSYFVCEIDAAAPSLN